MFSTASLISPTSPPTTVYGNTMNNTKRDIDINNTTTSAKRMASKDITCILWPAGNAPLISIADLAAHYKSIEITPAEFEDENQWQVSKLSADLGLAVKIKTITTGAGSTTENCRAPLLFVDRTTLNTPGSILGNIIIARCDGQPLHFFHAFFLMETLQALCIQGAEVLTRIEHSDDEHAVHHARSAVVSMFTSKFFAVMFDSTKQHIVRKASPYHAVHIVLERESGKTGDAFVELSTTAEAAYVISAIEQRTESGHTPEIPGFESLENPFVHATPKCQGCATIESLGGAPLLKCSRCENAWYCGKECQRKMWTLHKRECTKAKELEGNVEKLARIYGTKRP